MSSGDNMVSWLDQAGLVPRLILRRLQCESDQIALDAVAARARELRDWLRVFVNERRGRPLVNVTISELGLLNRTLAADEKFSRVVPFDAQGSAATLHLVRRWSFAGSLLPPIAEAVADLICQEDFSRIKTCKGCGLVFLDRSRRQGRKWCRMSTCGNRAKQAAHRKRFEDSQH